MARLLDDQALTNEIRWSQMNAVARLNFHFLYILTSTHPSSASRDNKVVATPYYYSKYTVNWNALSHSEINKTELFKPKWLVSYPVLKL